MKILVKILMVFGLVVFTGETALAATMPVGDLATQVDYAYAQTIRDSSKSPVAFTDTYSFFVSQPVGIVVLTANGGMFGESTLSNLSFSLQDQVGSAWVTLATAASVANAITEDLVNTYGLSLANLLYLSDAALSPGTSYQLVVTGDAPARKSGSYTISMSPLSAVPLPSSAVALASALMALMMLAWRRRVRAMSI